MECEGYCDPVTVNFDDGYIQDQCLACGKTGPLIQVTKNTPVVSWEELAEDIRVQRLSPVEALQEALEAWLAEGQWDLDLIDEKQAKRFATLLATKGYRVRPIYERDRA